MEGYDRYDNVSSYFTNQCQHLTFAISALVQTCHSHSRVKLAMISNVATILLLTAVFEFSITTCSRTPGGDQIS